MFNAIKRLLAGAATYQPRMQLQLVIRHPKMV
jgi:hypothetical protein